MDVPTIQDHYRRDATPQAFLASLEHRYKVTDPDVLRRAGELLEELYQHTPRWELGGWAPAEVE